MSLKEVREETHVSFVLFNWCRLELASNDFFFLSETIKYYPSQYLTNISTLKLQKICSGYSSIQFGMLQLIVGLCLWSWMGQIGPIYLSTYLTNMTHSEAR